QTLEVVEHGAFLIDAEGRAAGHEEALAAGVAVGALGDADEGDLAVEADVAERVARGVQLALAAVDEHEIGPAAEFGVGVLDVALLGEVDAAVGDLAAVGLLRTRIISGDGCGVQNALGSRAPPPPLGGG